MIERARELPGFENFLWPKRFEKLCAAAKCGPVVVINIHKARCDALVLMADLDEPIHTPLSEVSYDQAKK